MIFDAWSVVVVPFPFADTAAAKPRPALVLSKHEFNRSNGHSVLAMITTASRTTWHDDVALTDWEAAGLTAPCVVRPKVFTLENRLLPRKIGELSARDRDRVSSTPRSMFAP